MSVEQSTSFAFLSISLFSQSKGDVLWLIFLQTEGDANYNPIGGWEGQGEG